MVVHTDACSHACDQSTVVRCHHVSLLPALSVLYSTPWPALILVPLHVGGFLRLSLVPLHHRFNAWAHKRNAFRWSCWDHGMVNCPQRNSHECGTDRNGKRYQQWVEIPKVFPDGYVPRIGGGCVLRLVSFAYTGRLGGGRMGGEGIRWTERL